MHIYSISLLRVRGANTRAVTVLPQPPGIPSIANDQRSISARSALIENLIRLDYPYYYYRRRKNPDFLPN